MGAGGLERGLDGGEGREKEKLTFATKTDDESARSAAAERRSGSMAESMRSETFVIPARDSTHKYTPQGVKLLSSATTGKAALAEERQQQSILCECVMVLRACVAGRCDYEFVIKQWL